MLSVRACSPAPDLKLLLLDDLNTRLHFLEPSAVPQACREVLAAAMVLLGLGLGEAQRAAARREHGAAVVAADGGERRRGLGWRAGTELVGTR
eukprot:CAMPEP_0180036072 /NCGR_PEP_ID=MMETSP0984-20121128/30682_1 /TAXON_ID=483367 /ORGANISM="non described non described, Strain CCMP 2436" /LENGTH=92 /DNA_ID=CAMNT_0021962123 /DNA_START=35 /DNA_END=310 /DNA_ORIENTATION=-